MNESRLLTGEGIERNTRLRGPRGEFIARNHDGYGVYRFVKPGVLKRLGKYKSLAKAQEVYDEQFTG